MCDVGGGASVGAFRGESPERGPASRTRWHQHQADAERVWGKA